MTTLTGCQSVQMVGECRVYVPGVNLDLRLQAEPPNNLDSEYLLVHWDRQARMSLKVPRPIREHKLRGCLRSTSGKANTFAYAVANTEDRVVFFDYYCQKASYSLAIAEQILIQSVENPQLDYEKAVNRLDELLLRIPKGSRAESTAIRAYRKLKAMEEWHKDIADYCAIVGTNVVDERAAEILMPLSIRAVRIVGDDGTPKGVYLGLVTICRRPRLVCMTRPLDGVCYDDLVAGVGLNCSTPLTGLTTTQELDGESIVIRRISQTNLMMEWRLSPPPFNISSTRSFSSSASQFVQLAEFNHQRPMEYVGDISKDAAYAAP